MNFETGQPVPRTEDPRLLKGAGKYTDDLNYPHQTQMIVVRVVCLLFVMQPLVDT